MTHQVLSLITLLILTILHLQVLCSLYVYSYKSYKHYVLTLPKHKEILIRLIYVLYFLHSYKHYVLTLFKHNETLISLMTLEDRAQTEMHWGPSSEMHHD